MKSDTPTTPSLPVTASSVEPPSQEVEERDQAADREVEIRLRVARLVQRHAGRERDRLERRQHLLVFLRRQRREQPIVPRGGLLGPGRRHFPMVPGKRARA